MLQSTRGCVSFCVPVRASICVISTVQTVGPILMKLSQNHLLYLCSIFQNLMTSWQPFISTAETKGQLAERRLGLHFRKISYFFNTRTGPLWGRLAAKPGLDLLGTSSFPVEKKRLVHVNKRVKYRAEYHIFKRFKIKRLLEFIFRLNCLRQINYRFRIPKNHSLKFILQ